MRLRLAIAFVIFGSTGCASLNAGRAMPASGPDHLAGWNTVPVSSLDAVWERAQSTGGVISVEPETQVAGTQAAWKKTWEAADSFLRLYWGDEPIWFPSDILRRTVCSQRVRWSYFWHFASGDERDLHPWFSSGFDHLVGPTLSKALASSGAVDVSSCADVGGSDAPCLYGEVTPPTSFDRWFCGGSKGACKDRLKSRPHDVNKEFTEGESVCVSGPWVHERVHGGRPEIHPAEVLWSRRSPRGDWRFAVVPDHSGRFEKRDLYRSLLKGGAKPAGGWSGKRPVELWVAFEHDARVPTEFDVATRCLKDGGEKTTPAPPIALPAPGGDFTPVPPPMPGMTMAARTWVKAASIRGLFVVRTDSRLEGCAAVVMALSGRPKADPPAALALAPVAAPAAAAVARMPAEVALPALRLRAVDNVSSRRRSLRGLEEFSVETRAGFAGGTPTEEDDQGVADGLNAALRRNATEREDIFGTDKPFLIQWEIEARRRSDNAVVAVRVGVAPQPGDQHVTVRTFRSDLTRAIRVNAGEGQAPPALAKEGLRRAGDILVSVPHGVTVRGRGNVQFMGSKPAALVGATAGIGFSSPTTADEWELLGEILQWIPGAAASTRLPKLQALACHPLPGPCSLSDLATHAQQQIKDPATRFEALHAFEDPQRTFARFLRHLAVAYLFNGSADSAEVQSLKTLLESACLKPAPGAPPAASFCE